MLTISCILFTTSVIVTIWALSRPPQKMEIPEEYVQLEKDVKEWLNEAKERLDKIEERLNEEGR